MFHRLAAHYCDIILKKNYTSSLMGTYLPTDEGFAHLAIIIRYLPYLTPHYNWKADIWQLSQNFHKDQNYAVEKMREAISRKLDVEPSFEEILKSVHRLFVTQKRVIEDKIYKEKGKKRGIFEEWSDDAFVSTFIIRYDESYTDNDPDAMDIS